MKVLQSNRSAVKPIQIRCLDPRIPGTVKISITLIIGHDQNDVGWSPFLHDLIPVFFVSLVAHLVLKAMQFCL